MTVTRMVCLIWLVAIVTIHSLDTKPRLSDTDNAARLVGALAELGLTVNRITDPSVLIAYAANCPSTVIAVLAAINGADDARVAGYVTPMTVQRHLYLGLVMDHAERWRMGLVWLRANAEAELGLRSHRAPTAAVVLFLPRACPELEQRDWSRLSPWHIDD